MNIRPGESYKHLVKPCYVHLERIKGLHFNSSKGFDLNKKMKDCLTCIDNETDDISKSVTQIEDCNRPSNNEFMSTYHELQEKVFPFIKPNKILQLIKCDELICEFGVRLLSNESSKIEKQRKSAIVVTITELGKFLLIIREKLNKTMSLEDFILSVKDDFLIDYVKEMVGFNKDTRYAKGSSVVCNLTKSLMECADILESKADMSKYVKDFKKLNDKSEVKKVKKCRNSKKQIEVEEFIDVECEANGKFKDAVNNTRQLREKRKRKIVNIWRKNEKEALVKHFKKNIDSKLPPTKTEINVCIDQEPVLKSRTWKEILCYIKGEMRRRQTWSEIEKEAVLRSLDENVCLKRIPTKMEIDMCFLLEPVLHKKSLTAIRNFICYTIEKYPEDNVDTVQNNDRDKSLQSSFEDIFELPDFSKDCFVPEEILPGTERPSSPVDEWLSKVITHTGRHWPKVYSELFDDSEEDDFDTISVFL